MYKVPAVPTARCSVLILSDFQSSCHKLDPWTFGIIAIPKSSSSPPQPSDRAH